MTYTHSFEDYAPPVRFNDVPYTKVRIEEAAIYAGPYTQIDLLDLTPVDTDPEHPAIRNFTTTLATRPSGYYRLIFVDAASSESPPTTPVLSPALDSQLVPTAASIRAESQVDFDDLGWEEDDPDPLQRVVDFCTIWLQDFTGRAYEDIDTTSTALADRKIVLYMHEAARMLVEYTAYVSQPDIIETAADFDQIQSFTADSYSETRRSVNGTSDKLHPYGPLAALLWDLLTDDRKAELQGDGPALDVVAPRWDVGREIIDAQRDKFIGPFGPAMSPWDNVPWFR